MAKVEGKVFVIPVGKAKPSATFSVSWLAQPKEDREKRAVEQVTRWARDKYRGCSVFVEKGTIRRQGDQGVGHIHVNGMQVASFTAVEMPPAPPAPDLFGGAR